MKRLAASMIAAAFIVGMDSGAQTDHFKVVAEFPGASLKWVRIAEPEFERRKLDLGNYTIVVMEEGDSVFVSLRSAEAAYTPGVRGSIGKHLGYVVEISKKDRTVVRSHFVR